MPRLRRHGARKGDDRCTRHYRARGSDRERHGKARKPREHAAGERPEQRSAALQACHRRNRAA